MDPDEDYKFFKLSTGSFTEQSLITQRSWNGASNNDSSDPARTMQSRKASGSFQLSTIMKNNRNSDGTGGGAWVRK